MSVVTHDYVGKIVADLRRLNSPVINKKLTIFMPNAPRSVTNMFKTLPEYVNTCATLDDFCQKVDVRRVGMYYLVQKIWNVPSAGLVRLPVRDVHDLIDIFANLEDKFCEIYMLWSEDSNCKHPMDVTRFRLPRRHSDTSHVLRELLVQCGNTNPELLAYDVELCVLNPPPDVHAFQGQLTHLLYWLGDAVLGAGLVTYSARCERRVIDSLDVLRGVLADGVYCMWLEWPSHKQEHRRKRARVQCTGCCLKPVKGGA